jgi:hypothetical protein
MYSAAKFVIHYNNEEVGTLKCMKFGEEVTGKCVSKRAHPNLKTGFVNKLGHKGLSSFKIKKI